MKVTPKAISRNAPPLDCPPDKSVTHRSFLFSLLSSRVSRVRRPLLGEDCLASLAAVRKLGGEVRETGDGVEIKGFGIRDFGTQPPASKPLEIDCQNSGTTIRLLSGLLSGQHGFFKMTGDASLSQRPMARVSQPLQLMGAGVFPRGEKKGAQKLVPTPPVDIEPAAGGLRPIACELAVASAQVKSAVLLAGLFCREGETSVTEPALSRDHTERMLNGMGITVRSRVAADGRAWAAVNGVAGHDLNPLDLTVGGDPSSAAFWAAAAVMQDRRVVIENVLLNPTRLGFVEVLRRMGVSVKTETMLSGGGEDVGRIEIAGGGSPKAVEVKPAEVPTLVDEVPILAIASLWARGTSVFRGVHELRVKESDRLEAIIQFITSIGGKAWAGGDDKADLHVEGLGGAPSGLNGSEWRYETLGDHRLAMAAVITADALRREIVLDDAECIKVSYPSFFQHREALAKS